jgi:hypothetical protein
LQRAHDAVRIPGTFQIWCDCVADQITQDSQLVGRESHALVLLAMLRMMNGSGDDFTILQGDGVSKGKIAGEVAPRHVATVQRSIESGVEYGQVEKIAGRRCERIGYRFILKDGSVLAEGEELGSNILLAEGSRRSASSTVPQGQGLFRITGTILVVESATV